METGTRKWGTEEQPENLYSSVTNPERFRPLYELALNLVAQLEAGFDVDRVEGYGLGSELEEDFELDRPPIKLTPRGSSSAPVPVAFTAFPGIAIRVGRWHSKWFPNCGCDACDETAEEEFSKFAEIVEAASGWFSERLVVSRFGDAWAERELWSDRSRRGGRSRVDLSIALGREAEETIEWMPWKRSGCRTARS